MSNPYVPRPQKEIQRAHDILHFLGSPEGPPLFDKEGSLACKAAHDTLAWVLGFPCGAHFAENLAAIQAAFKELGIREIDAGEPLSIKEAKGRGLI